MQITSTHSVLGWYWGNQLRTEQRHIYHYDKGNDVTVVERRYITIHAYDNRARVIPSDAKGTKIDIQT